ncbi:MULTISPECIES: hypothetical protein [unclassified Streptomyces]|uniref:hypothetical protein n=1 Tax=unclassified Streptomyces TaxID=2593676 RepID=UPI002E126DBB
MAHLMGEHGAQLGLGQSGHQRQTEAEPAPSADQAEEPGVLADRGVHLAVEHDLVGGTGAGLPGDVADGGPEPGLLGVGDRQPGQAVVLRRTQHEHAPHDRDRQHDAEDEQLRGDTARRPCERGPVEGAEGGEQDEAQQIEAGKQDKSAGGAQSWAHRADPPQGQVW